MRFREKVSLKDKQSVVASLGAKDARGLIGASLAYRIPLRAGQDPEAAAAQLRVNPAVELAEPNYLISADEVSANDPRSFAQWALKGSITGSEAPDFRGIPAFTGRQQQANDSQSTVIAVIDSGIDFTHPDLSGYQWKNSKEEANGEDDDLNDYRDDLYGWDWVAKSNAVKDGLGHGTRVAGIIASQGSQAATISGIQWRLNLMSLRVLDSAGVGDVASAVEAIDYAVAHGAKVINCSWGTDESSVILREAIERAGRLNVLVVSSAGNESRDIEQSSYYPASYGLSNLLVVAATGGNGALLASSNVGATHVQVAAPGENVLTTGLKRSYEAMTGTSASAAVASAFAGLVKSLRPGLRAERTREMIIAGGKPVESLNGKVSSGRVIDAAGAIARVNSLQPDEGRENAEGSSDNPQNGGNGSGTTTAPAADNGNSGNAPARTKGAPGPNLPNLDQMRNQRPIEPKAPPPVPSTRCPLQLPDCGKKKGQTNVNDPAGLLPSARAETPANELSKNLLASNFNPPSTDTFSGNNGRSAARSVSDSGQPSLLSLYKSLIQRTAAATEQSGLYFALALNAPPPPVENVVWTNVVGVSASGNTLSRASGWGWDAGAVSTQSIASGDGYVEATVSDASTYKMFGLSNGDSNQYYSDIDFAVYMDTGALLHVYEGGVYRGQLGTYAAGDIIRVAVEGGLVKYSKNGTVFYTSGVSPTYPLLVDTSLYSTGSQLSNVIINRSSAVSVAWMNVVGAAASGNSLSKTWPDAWNGGAVSTQSITSGDGYVEVTASETGTYRMFGLSNGDSNQYYSDIDFACYMAAGGGVYVYESGSYRGAFGSYTTGDKLRVAVEGGVVKYSKNGTVFYTSGVSPTYPLLVDTSLYNIGSTLSNAVMSGNGVAGSSEERSEPTNRTGQAGEDLLSRNYNWSLPIVGLPGRAGLNLGLSLTYNSLVWTKSGSTIAFDTDHGFPSPGFRLGFPVIQGKYANAQGGLSYLMITPSGARVELRQAGTVYKSADSSYMQLTEVTPGSTLLVQTKDGTQLSYERKGSDYQCTQIKDRNGNFISVTYNAAGRISVVKDTLGRDINFNYDANQNLISITQAWVRDAFSGQVTETHTWATFGWDNLTVQTSFSGLTLSGVYNGQTIPVLKQVGLPDGSYYTFDYTAWGQVSAIKNYEVTNSLFSSVTYNLDTSAGQTDCPRFTQRRDFVRDWNNNAEAVSTFSAFNPASGVADVTMPDGTVYKELFYASGWANGLTYQSEIWSGGVRRKWTTVDWTQDNTSYSYQENPRPTDISIYDEAGNRRRTYIDYGQYAQYGLPYGVWEYQANGTTPYRVTFYDYNLSQAYLDKHIIGLVSEVHVSDTQVYVAKMRYEYDAGGEYLQATSANAVQHDGAYSTSWTARGNVTSVSRYDVSDITNQSKKLTSSMGYDTNGSVIFSRDHQGHQSSVSYTDSFSEGGSRNTFAYPTTLTDADSNSSTFQYNYAMGVVSQTRVPSSGTGTGTTYLEHRMKYDAAGRPERTINQNSGAYTRWVYTYSTLVQQFTTLQTGASEAYTFATYDAAGRMTASGSDHPNSTGGYATTLYRYNVMGRLSEQSNPTEMTAYWIPAGDDVAGWVWSYQQYDWNGRPTVTTNADGTTKQASYSGCGCAVGEVTTLTGETLGQGNRRQKIYRDMLGRVVKTETLNWDSTVYSAVVTSYNARDQVTNVRQYAGPEGSSTYQDTVMTYDDYGRLWKRKAPAQQSPGTTYTYNSDGTVQKVTDARGAETQFSYNNRHLVTGISYTVPSGSGITPSASVSYSYDAAGNRTAMTDGMGSASYQYNNLGQMTQESRWFTGGSSPFNITYSYNLGGQLASITDSFSSTVSYSYDQIGRISSVNGSGFANVAQYAGNMQYRAWGALKHEEYGNTRSVSIGYNSRLLPTSLFIQGVMSKGYEYNADGSLSYSQDYLNDKFDRAYTYDHAGRITAALSGPAARGLAD
ncbi:MAG TPA: S8 family serine peptidase, partial [Pyrinomonadaceae bacterium]|nr:S8 family serine peptidase [Pyrinomonadaceae bacterium]